MLDKKINVVIALGYFDCVHIGHRKVLKNAFALAEKLNSKPVVFTFNGNLKGALKGQDQGSIYTTSERLDILKNIGVEEVYSAPIDKQFLSLSAKQFLDKLNSELNIVGYVSGDDYRFGFKGEGNLDFLKEYACKRGQEVLITQTQMIDQDRVSTSLIKTLLTSGDMDKANYLLGRNYSITGEVIKDRRVGTKIGFPTANIKVDKDKHPIKNGVYHGTVKVDGKNYKAIINYGARPTFNLHERKLEAHLLDFDGNLYGQTLTVFFDGYMRDIVAFKDSDALKEQLQKDLRQAKDIK